jgi:hypothetical protein
MQRLMCDNSQVTSLACVDLDEAHPHHRGCLPGDPRNPATPPTRATIHTPTHGPLLITHLALHTCVVGGDLQRALLQGVAPPQHVVGAVQGGRLRHGLVVRQEVQPVEEGTCSTMNHTSPTTTPVSGNIVRHACCGCTPHMASQQPAGAYGAAMRPLALWTGREEVAVGGAVLANRWHT